MKKILFGLGLLLITGPCFGLNLRSLVDSDGDLMSINADGSINASVTGDISPSTITANSATFNVLTATTANIISGLNVDTINEFNENEITVSTNMVVTGEIITSSGFFQDRGDPAAVDVALGALTTDATWRDLDLSSIAPANTKTLALRIQVLDADAATSVVRFRENGNSNTINIAQAITLVANFNNYYDVIVACDSGRIIEYNADNVTWNTINITVAGWWK